MWTGRGERKPTYIPTVFFPPSCLSNCGEDEEQAEERGQRWALHLPRPAGRRHPALQVSFLVRFSVGHVSARVSLHMRRIISDSAVFYGRGLVPLEKNKNKIYLII